MTQYNYTCDSLKNLQKLQNTYSKYNRAVDKVVNQKVKPAIIYRRVFRKTLRSRIAWEIKDFIEVTGINKEFFGLLGAFVGMFLLMGFMFL